MPMLPDNDGCFPTKMISRTREMKRRRVAESVDIKPGLISSGNIADKVKPVIKSGLTSKAEHEIENMPDVGSSAEDRAENYHMEQDIRSGRYLDDVPEDDGSRDYE